MSKLWDQNIDQFIALANKYKVRMLMVGGGAVNFHGYQRHSADVDFWIETTEENFKKLVMVFIGLIPLLLISKKILGRRKSFNMILMENWLRFLILFQRLQKQQRLTNLVLLNAVEENEKKLETLFGSFQNNLRQLERAVFFCLKNSKFNSNFIFIKQ